MWIPTTEAELVTAAESNSLIEGTYLELKRDLARGTDANKELARDLASLAVSGGVLVFGIVDQGDRDPGAPGSALVPYLSTVWWPGSCRLSVELLRQRAAGAT